MSTYNWGELTHKNDSWDEPPSSNLDEKNSIPTTNMPALLFTFLTRESLDLLSHKPIYTYDTYGRRNQLYHLSNNWNPELVVEIG